MERQAQEPRSDFALESLNTQEIIETHRKLAQRWESEYLQNREELWDEAPGQAEETAFYNEVQALLEAAERSQSMGEALDGSGNVFDQLLGGHVVVALTRHDPERGKRIWEQALTSYNHEVNTVAAQELYRAIRDGLLPPEALAFIAASLALTISKLARNVPAKGETEQTARTQRAP